MGPPALPAMGFVMQALLLWGISAVAGNDAEIMTQHSSSVSGSALALSDPTALRAVTVEEEGSLHQTKEAFYVANGTQRCTTAIGSSSECQAAAQALGLKWDGERRWGSRYRGCLKDTNGPDGNFNVQGDHHELMGHELGQVAVCHAGSFTACSVARSGERCAVAIGSPSECEAAAAALGLRWDGVRKWSDRHRGCLRDFDGNEANFNLGGDGGTLMGMAGGQLAVCHSASAPTSRPDSRGRVPTPSPAPEAVSVAMVVEGVDYNSLQVDADALASFKGATELGIAEAVGVPHERVEVEVSEGSIKADLHHANSNHESLAG